MSFCVLGDLHLGRSLYDYDLTASTRELMYLFSDYAITHDVEYAVCLGDVFDRPTPSERLRKIFVQWCNEFERAEIPLFVLAGNHDCLSDPLAGTSLASIKSQTSWKYVVFVDRPFAIKNSLFLPSPSPGLFKSYKEYLRDVKELLKSNDVLDVFTHLDIEGATIGDQEMLYRCGEYTLPFELFSKNVNFYAGHIHKPQYVERYCFIVGAANRLRFDERNDSRHFIYYNEGEQTIIVLPAVLLRQLELDATKDIEYTILKSIPNFDFRDQIVKVVTYIDESTNLDWSYIEKLIYSKGANYVYIAPPIRKGILQEKKRVDVSAGVYDQAKEFIRNNVKDRKEAKQIFNIFKKVRKRADESQMLE